MQPGGVLDVVAMKRPRLTPHPTLLMAQEPTPVQRGAVQVLAPALYAVGTLLSG